MVHQCEVAMRHFISDKGEKRSSVKVFGMLSFQPVFSLSSFTFIKRLVSSSLLSAVRVISSAYLRLLVFLPEIFSLVSDSSNLAFCMIYSAYQLNKMGDNTQP